MSLRRNTTNENDRAATGPRRSLAPYGGPIFRRGAEIHRVSQRKSKETINHGEHGETRTEDGGCKDER